MAITGTGTQADPWIVHNLSELRDACGRDTTSGVKFGGFISLDEDINCNEQCPDGWTTIQTAHNIGLNGHAIIAPVIKDGNSLFKCIGNTVPAIRNGYIHNLYTNYTSQGNIFDKESSYGFALERVQLEVRMRGESSKINLSRINKCQIEISGTAAGSAAPFINTPIENDVITKTRFILNYKAEFINYFRLMGSNENVYVISDCLFEGNVENLNINSGSREPRKVSQGYIKSSIIAVKTDTNSFGYNFTNNCLISEECKAVASGSQGEKYISEADLNSVQKVTDAGFTVIEVV